MDLLNPKSLCLSGQLSISSIFHFSCPFVVLHGQSSHVVTRPQKNYGNINTLVTGVSMDSFGTF